MFGDGLEDEVLFCCGDSLEEDLRWEPRLGVGVFVDLVEMDDEANGVAFALDCRSFERSFLFLG